jgi:ankyrin repeat protein
MSKKGFGKNLFKVTSPCSQDWNEMKGNDKVRFCEHCALEVNNISAMTRKAAMKMVRESEGRICVRYVKNPANDKPVFADKLYQIARCAPRLAVGAMTAALGFSSMAYAQGDISAAKMSDRQIEISRDKDSKKDKTEKSTASISGTIFDPNGAVVPGIVVSLSAENESRTVTSTNDEGFYEFKDVEIGTYTFIAEGGNGFRTHQIEGLVISDSEELKNDVTMEVDAEETVTVGGIGAVEYELPLLQAVSEENTDEIKSLIANGASVNAKDKNYDGITAIFVAVESGNIETVRILLDYGAKVNVRDAEKRTPLMRLDSDAMPKLVKLLLNYGAKINAVDAEGNNVLHHVAFNVNSEVLQTLIVEGADINAQNEDGQTPLMIAAEYENLNCVKALLDAGATVNLRDKSSKTALGIAKDNDYTEIAELLISFGAKE